MNLTGTIISIGRHDRDGEAVHGVLVEIPREQLQQGGILYREVLITGLPVTESTTEKLVAQLRARHAKGLAKYGTTVDRTDLTPTQWVQHMREELMDGLAYLERIQDHFETQPPTTHRKET